jgi:hypothetical protein
MRTYDEYRRILELWEQGVPKKRIALTLGIPRVTVRDCIERYGSVKGLEENKERALKSAPGDVLEPLLDPFNVHLRQPYAYLLGIYLGDGNITKVRKVYRLRVTLDASYPGIIERCTKALQIFLPTNQIGIVEHYYRGRLSCVDVSCYHKFWPEIFPQHGSGPKHLREIKLHDWQQTIIETYPLEFFRGLYHSDGSRFSNVVKGKDYPRYQFSNVSEDIRRLFCATCDRLGLHWTVKRQHSGVVEVLISKRKDVAYLDQHVGPKM